MAPTLDATCESAVCHVNSSCELTINMVFKEGSAKLCASRYRSNSPSDLPPLRAPSAIPVCKCEMSSSCPNWARYGHRMLVTSEQPQKLRRRIADPSEITPELLKVHLHFGMLSHDRRSSMCSRLSIYRYVKNSEG